jgi:hypothetical protein
MLLRQLEHQSWVRRHVPQDTEMGPPADGWEARVDFQNAYEAGWFECPVRFFDGEVPDTEPILRDEGRKTALLDADMPHPYQGGMMRRNWVFFDAFRRKQEQGFEYEGRPIVDHLCGGATHHFTFLRDRLDIQSFDTGFPVDFGSLRQDVGPQVEIKGGPSVTFLQQARPAQVHDEVAAILATGIAEGGRLILREGNNLPPDVDLDVLWAFYNAVCEIGAYEEAVACS